jgi:hypothetical protein
MKKKNKSSKMLVTIIKLTDIINQLDEQKVLTIGMIERSVLWAELPDDMKGLAARQIIWHLKNNVIDAPNCSNNLCNNTLVWSKDKNKYLTYCCAKCRARCDVFKTSLAESNLKNHGYNFSFQNPVSQARRKETMVENYGYEFSFQDPTIHDIAKHQNSVTGTETRRQTMITRYNVDYVAHINMPLNVLQTLSDKETLTSYLLEDNPGTVASMLNVDRNTVIRYIRLHDIDQDLICKKCSGFEKSVYDYVASLVGPELCVQNDFSVIGPLEVDINVPSFKIAIECNGDYWHSDLFKRKDYHYIKWEKCNDVGVQLIHIAECDWYNKTTKIKSMLKSHFKQKQSGIGGRSTYVASVDGKTARAFVNKYHLQNFVGGQHFGAFDKNHNLLAIMTFGWTRGSKESRRRELKRWVTDNFTHPGLFSKVFKYAHSVMKFAKIVSYSMNDWFTGNIYLSCNFVRKSVTYPDYYYIIDGCRTHCSNFTKSNIKLKFPAIYDHSQTEKKMMDDLGILRTWTAGKTEWIWYE